MQVRLGDVGEGLAASLEVKPITFEQNPPFARREGVEDLSQRGQGGGDRSDTMSLRLDERCLNRSFPCLKKSSQIRRKPSPKRLN